MAIYEKLLLEQFDVKSVISSVGHQTDNTIADLVDQRASTPTQAGVIASPELTDADFKHP